MPGVADMNVRIGADISEVLSKVDAAKAKLNSLVEAQGQLKDKINDVNTSLRLNEKELTAANVKLQNLNTSSKDGKTAAANLRNEISQLAKNSALLNTELTTAKTTLATTTAEIKTQTVAVKQAETAHSGLAAGATKVYSGLRKLAYIIPGMGIAGIISLISGPLIDAFSQWYDSVTKLTDAQQLLKDNIKNTSDINKTAAESVAKQTASLTTLYAIATDVNRSMYARVGAVKELQKEFPDYFKNISQENILNGNAKAAYDALTDSLIANALAKAQLGKITDIGVKRGDLQSQVDDLIAERKRQLDAIKGAKISTPSLGGSTGAAATVISADQQKADIITFFDRQLIPLQSKINSFDNQIKSIRDRLNPAALLSGDGQSSKSNPAATGILAVFDAQIKVLKDYKDNIATTATEIASVNAQIKKIQEEKAKYDPTYKLKKDPETISDVLQKLKAKLDAIKGDSITLDTKQAQSSISAVNSAIDVLFTKFKLNNKSPQIIALRAQVTDFELIIDEKKAKDIIDKAVLGDRRKPIEIPPFIVHSEAVLKLESKIQQGTEFNEQILREQLQERLKAMGITKTVSIPIGVDITGNTINTKGGETITSGTSTTQLQATFKDATEKLKSFSDNASNIVNNMAADMAVSIGEAIGNAFTGQGDAVKGLFDGIFSVLGSALQQLGKVAIETGLGIKAIRESFKSLNPIVAIAAGVGLVALGTIIKNSVQSAGAFANGGLVKAFSNGGPVWGAGTATSDSIPARLSKGEYVIRAAKVREFGLDFFNKINFGSANMRDILRDKFGMMKFATGGFVSPNGINLSQPISIPNINIGGGQQIFIAESKLRGQDIVTSFKRASATISRNS